VVETDLANAFVEYVDPAELGKSVGCSARERATLR